MFSWGGKSGVVVWVSGCEAGGVCEAGSAREFVRIWVLRKHSRGTLGYVTHYNNTISLSLFTSWEHEAELERFDISHRSLTS